MLWGDKSHSTSLACLKISCHPGKFLTRNTFKSGIQNMYIKDLDSRLISI